MSFGSSSSSFTINVLPIVSSNGTAGAPDNANLWSQSGSTFKFLDGPSGGSGITWGDWSAGTIDDLFTIRDDELSYYSNMWGSDWSVTYSDGDFYLNFSAVPEPSTYIMVAGLLIIPALRNFRGLFSNLRKKFKSFFFTLFLILNRSNSRERKYSFPITYPIK